VVGDTWQKMDLTATSGTDLIIAMRPSCGLWRLAGRVLPARWRVTFSTLGVSFVLPAAGRDSAAAVATPAVRTRFDGSGSHDHRSPNPHGLTQRRTTVTRNFDCSGWERCA
jgi:hypothetical protein